MSAPSLPHSLAIGSDHGGLDLKNAVVAHLQAGGYAVEDLGTHDGASVDYPDFAELVSVRVLDGRADAGILVCTTGIGMSIAANRHAGIQASLVHDAVTAAITRKHNASNILCLAGKTTPETTAKEIVDTWLKTPFAGGRHGRRVDKMNTQAHPLSILATSDPAVAEIIRGEQQRQQDHIELIASENFTSKAVMAAQGSCLTNKYAEGYPGKRWYGGCEEVDKVEQLAIDRACELFGAKFANVQPHSGSQANAAAYAALIKPGDSVLGMSLAHGGHLTHGSPVNFSGKLYQFHSYGLNPSTGEIDYEEAERLAKLHQPKLIVTGFSAYSRIVDWQRFREIADSVGAYLLADMAHIAGLVAVGLYPSPVNIADVTTSTTHKTLRGPRGGLILAKDNPELHKKLQSAVFPGGQGGPLMHVIAAKAVAFQEALKLDFKTYQQAVLDNARALAETLQARGFKIVSGGTDNHLILIDLIDKNLTGKDAEAALGRANITTNKNAVPNDPQSPFITSGIRIGSPAITTRGMRTAECVQIAHWMADILNQPSDESTIARVKQQVLELCKQHPVY